MEEVKMAAANFELETDVKMSPPGKRREFRKNNEELDLTVVWEH